LSNPSDTDQNPVVSTGRRVGVLGGDSVTDVTGVNAAYTPPELEQNTKLEPSTLPTELVEPQGSTDDGSGSNTMDVLEVEEVIDTADSSEEADAEPSESAEHAQERQGISTLDSDELEAALLAASEGAVAELDRSEDVSNAPEPVVSADYDDGRDLLGGEADSWSFGDALDAPASQPVAGDSELRQELRHAKRRVSELETEGMHLRAAVENMNAHQSKLNEDLHSATEKLVQSLQDRLTYRQRMDRERQEMSQFANERLVTDLLPSLDSFERAIEHADADSSDPFVSGIRMVRQQMMQTLQRFNVEAFRSTGEVFDPARHEAYTEIETADQAPGTVVDVAKTGYLLSGRLLRPALVSVARAPHKKSDAEVGTPSEEDPVTELETEDGDIQEPMALDAADAIAELSDFGGESGEVSVDDGDDSAV